jgi:hypothetical protein
MPVLRSSQKLPSGRAGRAVRADVAVPDLLVVVASCDRRRDFSRLRRKVGGLGQSESAPARSTIGVLVAAPSPLSAREAHRVRCSVVRMAAPSRRDSAIHLAT